MYTGSITIPRRVCVWVIYTGNRDLPRWSFSDVASSSTLNNRKQGIVVCSILDQCDACDEKKPRDQEHA